MIKLSCATLSIEGFGQTNFDKTFEVAPKIGFKNIEFNCWYPSSLAPATIRSLKQRCAKHGLEAMAIHLNGGFGGDPVRDFCHKLQAMQAVKMLGGRMIVSSGYTRGENDDIQGVIRSLKDLVPVAEEMDVLISLENHVNNNIENIDDYRRIFDAINSKHVGICIDTGHFDAAGVDMDALIDEFAPFINHIHLKENKGIGEKVFTRFKEGTTDNHHIVERMISLGYSGYMTIELSPEIGEKDGRPFTIEDLILPYTMFSGYENS